MRIGIQTWGSEGDIRPFLALGHALSARGHRVELLYTEIGHRRYEAVARTLGFSARAIASPVVANDAELYEIGLKVIHARDQLQQGLLISRQLLEPGRAWISASPLKCLPRTVASSEASVCFTL